MSALEQPVFAKDATVTHLWQASCHRRGCGWTGPARTASADAHHDRSAHLDEHRKRYKQQFQQQPSLP